MNKPGLFIFIMIAFFSAAHGVPAQAGRPAWVAAKPRDTAALLYFTSSVDNFSGEEEAKKTAINTVYGVVAGHVIVHVQSAASERTQATQTGSGGAVTDDYTTLININTDSFTDIILAGIKTEIYSEAYYNEQKLKRYRAWALASVSPGQIEKNRQAYAQRIEKLSQQYSDELSKQDSSFEALRACRRMLAGLDPLQRSLVEYIGPDGRANLYEYLSGRIQTLAAGVYSAAVEFGGEFNFSDSEKDALAGALQSGLQAVGSSLRLVTPPRQAAQARFKFVITGEISVAGSAEHSLVRWKLPGLAVRLLFDGESLLGPEYFPVTELGREYLVFMTAKAIREKTSFYQRIKEKADL
ncbi:MAG: hypothetical protein LBQ88_16005 [Treponema sp.]|jgi:hypothetical protein|nr:hypothetical protein [Treponema sp.]